MSQMWPWKILNENTFEKFRNKIFKRKNKLSTFSIPGEPYHQTVAIKSDHFSPSVLCQPPTFPAQPQWSQRQPLEVWERTCLGIPWDTNERHQTFPTFQIYAELVDKLLKLHCKHSDTLPEVLVYLFSSFTPVQNISYFMGQIYFYVHF